MYNKELQKMESVEFQYKGYIDIFFDGNLFWKGKFVDDIDIIILFLNNRSQGSVSLS